MRGKLWVIGEAFSGEDVALREVGENRHEVYYCWKKLGVMDAGAAPNESGSAYRQLSERAKSRRVTEGP